MLLHLASILATVVSEAGSETKIRVLVIFKNSISGHL